MSGIYLEIFGYIGTALVIISMMMTSIIKLRIFNMCGGVISLIYAVLTNTWPVALLNACLVCINLFQTIRGLKQKTEYGYTVETSYSGTVKFFLSCHEKDVCKIRGEQILNLHENAKIYLVFVGSEIVGAFSIIQSDVGSSIEFAYVIPKYREKSIGDFLLSCLNDTKKLSLTVQKGTSEYNEFLSKLGF